MAALTLAAMVLLLSACAPAPTTGPQAAHALIEESAAAMGGWAAMDAVRAQQIVSSGEHWEPLQAMEPGGAARSVSTFEQTTLVDLAGNRVRIAFDGSRSYPAAGPLRFVEIIDGGVGMIETTDAQGKATRERLNPSRRVTRLRDFNRLPVRVLYVAKNAPDLTRVDDQAIGGSSVHVLRYSDGGLPVELQIDGATTLPARVIYTEDDTIYGDTLNALAFSDWTEDGGLRLPRTYSLSVNGNRVREERVRSLTNNPSADQTSFAIPDEVRAQAENGEPIVSQWTLRRAAMGVGYQDFGREQRAQLAELAPGVYHATGTSHHSLAVEMSDHIVVIEAPLYGERSAAVISAIEEKIPGKPIRYAVLTHFHNDHSGGIRPYAARGATLVAHESLVPFVQDVLARPKTVRPDDLARAGTKGAVEPAGDVKVLSDGTRTIELRQVSSPHAAAMLVAYLPKERLVFVSDLYAPGGPIDAANPNVRAFYTAVTGAKLAVDRVVGGHGGVVPFRDLTRAMAAAKPGS